MLRREAPLLMLGMVAEAVAPHKGMGGGRARLEPRVRLLPRP